MFEFLPTVTTLEEELTKLKIRPEIEPFILAFLKHKVITLPETEKLCVSLWDEMSIKSQLTYDERTDKVCGTENWGLHRTN